jgi:hypothetical protein
VKVISVALVVLGVLLLAFGPRLLFLLGSLRFAARYRTLRSQPYEEDRLNRLVKALAGFMGRRLPLPPGSSSERELFAYKQALQMIGVMESQLVHLPRGRGWPEAHWATLFPNDLAARYLEMRARPHDEHAFSQWSRDVYTYLVRHGPTVPLDPNEKPAPTARAERDKQVLRRDALFGKLLGDFYRHMESLREACALPSGSGWEWLPLRRDDGR